MKVFICAGQSNMIGMRSIASSLPTRLKAVQDNLIFTHNSWVQLCPDTANHCMYNPRGVGFGPELSFASKMGDNMGEPIGIIKLAYGSSTLAHNWSPSCKTYDQINLKSITPLYSMLIKKINAAMNSMNLDITGMIWMQGESDSTHRQPALQYGENLENFITSLRRDLNAPEMPFVAGRVNPPHYSHPYVSIVKRHQELCEIDNYAYINCDQLPVGPDELHYTTTGILNLGYRFCDRMWELLS